MTIKMVKTSSNPFPWYGWLGIASMIATEILLHTGSKFVSTWMTPLMWTGYILTIDALVFKIQGNSWLRNRLREVPFLILISVGVWILFEVYNFHLKNWQYVGVPADMLLRDIGFFWSFATIMPGVFITFGLLNSLLGKRIIKDVTTPPSLRLTTVDWISICIGFAMVTIPIFLKEEISSYLFAFIWIGYIPLLDPINKRLGAPTLSSLWKRSNRRIVTLLLAAGFICGLFWETWNYQAFQAQGAFWIYTIPQPLRIFGLHYGKMPVLGLLGFPPFALELYAFYQFFRKCCGGDHIFGLRGRMII
jgi:hypothetical protein